MSIKDEIAQVEKKIKELEYQLSVQRDVLHHLKACDTKRRRSSRKTASVAPRVGSLAANIKKVLENSEGPLTVAEIIERVKKQGYSSMAITGIGSLVPSAMSRRPDIFVRVRRGVYDLKSRQVETILTE